MKQSQGLLVPPKGLQVIFWAISFEMFGRHWNPYQVGKVNCLLTTSTWTRWNLKFSDIDSWLPHHQPVRGMSTSWSCTCNPLPHSVFKNISPECHWVFWALATLKPCNKCCPLLHCHPESGEALLHAGEQTEIWLAETNTLVTSSDALTCLPLLQCALIGQQGVSLAWRLLIGWYLDAFGGWYHSNSVGSSKKKHSLR